MEIGSDLVGLKISDNKVLLICNILNNKYSFELSGHPYEPRLFFKNEDINKTFSIGGGLYFPSIDEPKDIWCRFMNDCYKEVVKFFIDNESDYTIRNKLRYLIYKYNWEDIKDKNMDTIGAYWQNGIASGTVNSCLMHFGYCCSCNRNENFFTVFQISKNLYDKLKTDYDNYLGSTHKYKTAPSNIQNEIDCQLKKYGTIICEGWNVL